MAIILQAENWNRNKTYGGRRAASRYLQGFVPCILAHHWRGIRKGAPLLLNHELNELNEFMEGKLKRIRFRHDGKIDFEIETEDGKRVTAAGCSLHINETDYGDR